MIALVLSLAAGLVQDDGRVLEARLLHLGNDRIAAWRDTTPDPIGRALTLRFDIEKPAEAYTLSLWQRDVHRRWFVEINGKRAGELRIELPARTTYYALPKGLLRAGSNTLRIWSKDREDDIVVGAIRLYERTLREVRRFGRLVLSVRDSERRTALPARIGIVDGSGAPADLYPPEEASGAFRSGVLYTRGDGLSVDLPAGEYRIAATRGMEWSREERKVAIREGRVTEVRFQLRREVDTTGYVAADPHVHTLTFSGHGDASVEERMLTLAGEGVELAVATDHNHHTDYAPTQRRMGLQAFFTPVTGNEVTTKYGHFNAFPLDPKGPTPPHQVKDWVKLIEGVRRHGARVIILNHPHWPRLKTGFFGRVGLDPVSGDRSDPRPFTFDAVELVNAHTNEPAPLTLLDDWFALLNRGEKLVAVGSSDSHTVGDPVGQGRTYVRSRTDDPARIDVAEICDSFLRGRIGVSKGIFADVRVEDRGGMGDLVSLTRAEVAVQIRVASPSWVRPRRAMIFLNGVKLAEREVPLHDGKPFDVRLSFVFPRPRIDGHLVCVVLGDGIRSPGWKAKNDYTIAITNPVYLDADGDGRYSSPRAAAAKKLESWRGDWAALEAEDPVIGIQCLSLLRERWYRTAERLGKRLGRPMRPKKDGHGH